MTPQEALTFLANVIIPESVVPLKLYPQASEALRALSAAINPKPESKDDDIVHTN